MLVVNAQHTQKLPNEYILVLGKFPFVIVDTVVFGNSLHVETVLASYIIMENCVWKLTACGNCHGRLHVDIVNGILSLEA